MPERKPAPKYTRADFDRWVTLIAPTKTNPEYGAGAPLDQPEATVPAMIRPLGSRDVIIVNQEQSVATHLIAFDFFPGITSAWKLRDDAGREFEFAGVPLEIGRQQFHEIQCVCKG